VAARYGSTRAGGLYGRKLPISVKKRSGVSRSSPVTHVARNKVLENLTVAPSMEQEGSLPC
jgi:hypothetical protein